MKIQNALVSNIFDRSQWYFAHVTTVTLSWRVQNIVVIGRVYFTLECFEFSSNFEFDRNMLSGTGARCECEIFIKWYIVINMEKIEFPDKQHQQPQANVSIVYIRVLLAIHLSLSMFKAKKDFIHRWFGALVWKFYHGHWMLYLQSQQG